MAKTSKRVFVGAVFGRWTVKNTDTNNLEGKYKVLCKCSCGRTEKLVRVDTLLNGISTMCKSCSIENKIPGKYRRTIKEYENDLKERGINIKVKTGSKFESVVKKVIHICPACGEDWPVTPKEVFNGTGMCVDCSNRRCESAMATILKQVFKHYYPNTKPECDLGFRGKGGRPCLYDVYVPELNTVFEFQSEYHDDEEQKKRDKEKKMYILNHKNKYKYVAIDHRDYTVIQAMQLYFPNITEIPSYIDLSRGVMTTKVLGDIQELLNQKKYSLIEIEKIVGNGCSYKNIQSAIRSGLLIKPNYKANRRKLVKGKIFQLSLEGGFLKEYEYASLAKGFSCSCIGQACRGEYSRRGHEYKGYLWYYGSDYEKIMKDSM